MSRAVGIGKEAYRKQRAMKMKDGGHWILTKLLSYSNNLHCLSDRKENKQQIWLSAEEYE